MALNGGHSGKDIGDNRGNPIIVLGKILSVLNSHEQININSVDAGTWVTAIPRCASVTFTSNKINLEILSNILGKLNNKLKHTHNNDEILISIQEVPNQTLSFDNNTSKNFINFISEFPDGVLLRDKKNLPILSTNLGTAWISDGSLFTENSIRSNCDSSVTNELINRVKSLEYKNGLSVSETFDFPGYKQSSQSEFIEYLIHQYKELFGKEPNLKEEHFLLECAWFAQKSPNLQYVSISPNINDPHSPNEKVSIPSMEKIWQYLKMIVKDLDKNKDINKNEEER